MLLQQQRHHQRLLGLMLLQQQIHQMLLDTAAQGITTEVITEVIDLPMPSPWQDAHRNALANHHLQRATRTKGKRQEQMHSVTEKQVRKER